MSKMFHLVGCAHKCTKIFGIWRTKKPNALIRFVFQYFYKGFSFDSEKYNKHYFHLCNTDNAKPVTNNFY